MFFGELWKGAEGSQLVTASRVRKQRKKVQDQCSAHFLLLSQLKTSVHRMMHLSFKPVLLIPYWHARRFAFEFILCPVGLIILATHLMSSKSPEKSIPLLKISQADEYQNDPGLFIPPHRHLSPISVSGLRSSFFFKYQAKHFLMY